MEGGTGVLITTCCPASEEVHNRSA